MDRSYKRGMKLSEEERRKILELRKSGWSLRKLAKEFHVSPSTIHEVVHKYHSEESNVLEQDMKFFNELTKAGVDSKRPILSKMIESTAFLEHLMFDFAFLILPDLLSMLKDEEIDMRNPELTARRIIEKFRLLKQLAEDTKINEKINELKALENEKAKLQKEIAELQSIIKEYDNALVKITNFVQDLKKKMGDTLYFLITYVPIVLDEEDKARYFNMLFTKLKEIWNIDFKEELRSKFLIYGDQVL